MNLLDHCTDNGTLHLILLPTEACNFRCTYCYEDFKLSRMEPEVVDGVERWISSRAPKLHTLRLTWFGGEPLLARDTIERVLEHAAAEARAHPQMRVSSDITTNAYILDRPLFKRLVALGVTQYQISFDGPREWHDRKRVRADGRGTFDRIWSNLEATRELEAEFKITVRLHVDAENRTACRSFIADYNRLFADDPRYQLFVRQLSRFGGPNDDQLRVLNPRKSDDILADLRAGCADAGEPAPDEGLDVCYAAKGNSWVVRADGRLNKCTIALNHPANHVGRLGADGCVHVEGRRLEPWMRGLWTANVGQLQCPMGGLEEALASAAAAQVATESG